jgi:hypothetical protein
MDDRKRRDSLAPKGAFGVETAAQSERAAAKTAALIAREPMTAFAEPFADNEPEISIGTDDDAPRTSAELCADALIPSEGDRVSVEDAMRALIDMRLERTRPSDDFGTFDVQSGSAVVASSSPERPVVAQPMNSLAPIELAPAKTPTATAPSSRKRSPFPIFAAAAIALLGVGVYRRLDRAPEAPAQPQAAAQAAIDAPSDIVAAPAPQAAADAPVIDEQEAEPIAEFEATGVSESEDAILTLGTPTIVNVDAPARAKPTVGPAVRTGKESTEKQATVATPRVAPKAEAAALPEAPSREAIVAGFNSVRDEVLACASGSGGVAPIEATIVSDGRITHATVGGYYQGTPQGSCIARALRKARFAPFGRDSIKVAFPYTL